MTDQPTAASARRIFQIGANHVVEDEFTVSLTNDQVRDVLKTTYPEVIHATIRERTDVNGNRIVEFLPQPGRKG